MSARLLLGCIALLIPLAGLAQGEALTFPASTVTDRHTVDYRCKGGNHLQVLYLRSATGDAFAYLQVAGQAHVFVNVTAASGAKYVSGIYVWWTRGEQGRLTLDNRAQAPLLDDCAAQADP